MNTQCSPVTGEIMDGNVFFAPIAYNKIDALLSEFTFKKNRINSFSEILIKEMNEVAHYFGRFYSRNNNNDRPPSLDYLTDKKGTIKALEAEYWSKVINLTGVLEIMPEKRRKELNNQIDQYETIEFNRANIQTTVLALLTDREKYFAERVDGVFRALSGEHVTNQPEGFSKRMILDRVNDHHIFYGDYTKKGYLHNLRVIVRKFAGLHCEGENHYGTTSELIKAIS